MLGRRDLERTFDRSHAQAPHRLQVLRDFGVNEDLAERLRRSDTVVSV